MVIITLIAPILVYRLQGTCCPCNIFCKWLGNGGKPGGARGIPPFSACPWLNRVREEDRNYGKEDVPSWLTGFYTVPSVLPGMCLLSVGAQR